MTYCCYRPVPSLVVAAVLASMAFLGCGESASPPPPPPPPFVSQEVQVQLGDHGGTLTLMTTRSGGYTRDGNPFQSGTTIEANDNRYKLTLADGTWSAEYVRPEPSAVALGTSGDALLVTREEDGSYQAGEIRFASGDVLPASNGNTYRLTLEDEAWIVEYVAPDPTSLELGTSGESLALTRREDGTYETGDGEPFQSGAIWKTASGSEYKLTLMDEEWSYEYVPPPPAAVDLGTSGETLRLTRQEDGRYEANGEVFASGDTFEAENGNMYRLTRLGNEWTAEFVPQGVTVRLGASGNSIVLTREEDGQYWLGRTPFESGSIRRAANGNQYRVILQDGEWTAAYIPQAIQVKAGESGTSLALLRLEDGTYLLDGKEVQSGDTVIEDGNEYVLTRSGNTWVAEFKTGSVAVDLPGGGTVTLTKEEDGRYALDGTVVRSGSTRLINGVRYRLTFGDGGWTATRRVFPTIPGPGGGSSSRTETDESKVEFGAAEFRLCDDCSTEPEDPGVGTFLEVGDAASGGGTAEYSVYELLGRSGIVSDGRTYVEAAREEIQGIVETIKNYIQLYELDAVNPDEHIRGDGSTTGLWTQALAALQAILGTDYARSDPWGGDSEVDFDDVDDVIEELEELIDALSSQSDFEDEFENAFAAGKDAEDYFEAPISRIKFGSTRNTRFAVYANKDAGADAGSGNWGSGAFAYSPLEQPDPDDLPTRGEATYRGDTVAVNPDTTNPTMYSGTIELKARFSTQRVDALITDLDDDDGDPWTYLAKDVESVLLPIAEFNDNGTFSDDDDATVRRPAGIGSDVSVASSNFKGQFVNGGSEILGTWKVGSVLEGAFGIGRSSSTSATRPTVNDRGAESKVSLATPNDIAPDGDGDITIDTFEFEATQLYRSKRASDTGELFVTTAKGEIDAEITKLQALIDALDTGTDRDPIFATTNAALGKIFGTSVEVPDFTEYPQIGTPAADDDTEAKSRLEQASLALSSESLFTAALADEEIFAGLVGEEQVDEIFDAVPYKLAVEFDYTNHNYTRFGAWSKASRDYAEADPNTPVTGVFAYSPLDQSSALVTDLSFSAIYEGSTIAVDAEGSIYRGFIQLTVDWSSATNAVTSFIRDLKDVTDNSWFQHASLDVGYILFEGMTASGRAITTTESVAASIRYRDPRLPEVSISGTTEQMSGKFVGTSIDGPLGVIGSWSVVETDGIDIEGAFGAELLP